MKKHGSFILSLVGAFSLLCSNSLLAQQPGDSIYYNAKIITVDDASFTSRLGTVAEAMHVRDGKILHIGANAQIRAMAGPNTKLVDLKGRTVVPGMGSTHEHPMDWDLEVPEILRKVVREDQIIVRFLENNPDTIQAEYVRVLDEAVKKARPGQWIYLVVTAGRNYQYSVGGNGTPGRVPTTVDGARITKQVLDMSAPNNPVIVRDIFVATLLNQRAIEILKTLPFYSDMVADRGGQPIVSEQTGRGAGHRWAVPDLLFKDFYPELREAYRLGLEWWAGYGFTIIGSACYNPRCMETYSDLDRRGEMPVRMMWAWNWRPDFFYKDSYFLHTLVSLLGKGSDYFWNGGGWPGSFGQSNCSGSSLPMLDNLPDYLRRATSGQAQGGGTQVRERDCVTVDKNSTAYAYFKAGGRQATRHTTTDFGIDQLMAYVETASKDAGFTMEQIRAKRQSFDHNPLNPRPDQVPRMKELGLVTGGNAFEIYDSSSTIMDLYGERGVGWVVAKKTLVDGGIINSFEVDRAIGTTDMTGWSVFSSIITRKGWDGKVYAPQQKLDRQTALKTATIWPAYYVLRENVLGSLEPGKWADFQVIDRDYLTIPEDDIAKIRVLLTVVGGKTVHLVPSLARELGMQPAGAQVTLGGPAAQW